MWTLKSATVTDNLLLFSHDSHNRQEAYKTFLEKMEEKFGFRNFGKPYGTVGGEDSETERSIESIKKLSARPNSFSFNIQKFLNIKQEDIVDDEVQEYKVTTSQNEKERPQDPDEEKDDDDEKGGVIVDDHEENETNYRSILMNSYQMHHQRKDPGDEETLWSMSRKLPRQKSGSGDRLLDIPCKVCGDRSSGKHYGIYSCDGELQTNFELNWSRRRFQSSPHV